MAKTSTNKFNIDVNQAVRSVDTLRTAIDTYNKTIREQIKQQGALKKTSTESAQEITNLSKELDRLKASVDKNITVVQLVNEGWGAGRRVVKEFAVDVRELSIQFDALGRNAQVSASAIDAALNRTTHNLQGLLRVMKSTPNPFASFAGGFGQRTPGPVNFGGVGSSAIVSPALRPPSVTQASSINSAFLSTNQQLLETYNRLNPAMRQNQTIARGLGHEYGLLGLGVRVLVVAQLHRFINLVTTSMSDAIRTAQQFSVRIAEIQTIQGRTILTTQEWAQRLRGLSDSFGIPILQAAEGAYQAISNQVVHAGNAVTFLREETKLAKTTVATLDQAVSATSTVINAFNFNLADTHTINAKLFEAVNIGRFRLEELGSQFGRTSILARQLGVSLDEELGALTLMTRKGLQADVALTLLTNVFNSLLKPSKELSGWLSSVGFNSGQAAIRALGFTNVMGKLAAEADKSADGLSDIAHKFQDLRALTGAGALTGFFSELTGDIDRLKNSAAGFDKAIDTTFKSLGQKASVQLQQAKNAFIDQFGTPILRTFVQLSEGAGGLGNAVDKLTTFVRGAAVVFGTYYATTYLVHKGQLFLASSTGKNIFLIKNLSDAYRVAEIAALRLATATTVLTLGITAIVGSIINARLTIQHYGAELDEIARKARTLAEETSERRLKGSLDAINKSFDELSNSVKRSGSALEIFISNTQARLNKVADSYEKAFKKLSSTIHSTFAEVEKVTAKSVAESLREAEKLERAAERARDRVSDIKDKEEGRKIEGLLTGEDSLAKVDILEREKTRIHAAAVAARAKDEEDSATHLFELVNRLAEKQKDILTKLREDALRERDTESHIRLRTHPATGLPILNRRGVATLRRSRETVHAPDDAAATALLARLNALEAERTRLVAERVRLETEAAAKATAAAKKAADDAKIKEKALEDLKDLLSSLEEGKKPAEFSAGVAKAGSLAKAAGLSPEAQLALLRDLKKQEVLLHRQAEIEKLNATIEAERKKVEVITKAIDDVNAKNKDAVVVSKTTTKETVNNTDEQLARLKDFSKRHIITLTAPEDKLLGKDVTPEFNAFVQKLEIANNKVKLLEQSGKDTTSALKELAQVQSDFQKFASGLGNATVKRTSLGGELTSGIGIHPSFKDPSGARFSLSPGGESLSLQLKKQAEATQAAINANTQIAKAQFELDKLKRQFGELTSEAAKVPLAEIRAAKASEDWAKRSSDSSRIINNGLSGTIAALEEIRRRIVAMPALPVPTGKPEGKAFGGSFAFGRNGIDSVNALLAPGEIVMTQSVSRAFGPFLHALNNTTSQNKSHGGSVTFGDINISAAAGTTDVQVRDIATKLQRLARRGMFSI